MDEPDIVSLSRIERLLELACAYNAPLSIVAESRGETYRYKSRMFEIKQGPSTNSLIIDHPVTDGPAIALKPKTKITLFFALDQGRFAFDSQVLRKTTFALGSRREISSLEITYPNVLKSGQRRAYYRVPAPIGKPISVECALIGETAELDSGESGKVDFPSDIDFIGHTVDISVGGALIAFKGPDRNLPTIGTKLVLQLLLAKNETPLVLKGIIRRIDEKPSTEETRVAVEFINTEERFEYKLAINRLYRYVAERQRQLIKSGAK